MKYFWLLLIFVVVSCYCYDTDSGENSKPDLQQALKIYAQNEAALNITTEKEKIFINIINGMFKNFTTLFQDGHPSTALPLKRIITCLEERNMIKALNAYINETYVLYYKDLLYVTWCRGKSNFDDETKKIDYIFFDCIERDQKQYGENKFLSTLNGAAKFHSEAYCDSGHKSFNFTSIFEMDVAKEILSDLPQVFESIRQYNYLIENRITPTEEDSCLPLKVVEAYEIIMVKSHGIGYEYREGFAKLMHITTTLLGKFPFKTRKECSYFDAYANVRRSYRRYWDKKEHMPTKAEESLVKKMNGMFENFGTDLFQDGHPSTALKKILTCLGERNRTEDLKKYFNVTYVIYFKDLPPFEQRYYGNYNYCKLLMDDKSVPVDIRECINEYIYNHQDNNQFGYLLSAVAKFHAEAYCDLSFNMTLNFTSVFEVDVAKKILTDLPQVFESIRQYNYLIENGITPTEENFCLPLKVVEAYEIIMVKSQGIDYGHRKGFAKLMHAATTLLGKFPFKTRKECS